MLSQNRGWATDNSEVIPYFQGGGQWHNNFVYSDKFFETGQAVLDYGIEQFGYEGSYDHVVSYAMPMLIVELLQSFYRITDAPNVTDTFENRYEELRKLCHADVLSCMVFSSVFLQYASL